MTILSWTLLKAYAIAEAFSAIFEAVGSWSLSDAEKLIIKADKYESLINKAASFKFEKDDNMIERAWKGTVSGISATFSSVKNQLVRLLGGVAPSFGETWDIMLKSWTGLDVEKEDFKTQLKDKYEIALNRNKGMIERQDEYLGKNPFLTSGGELREKDDPYLKYLPLEELMEFLDNATKKLGVFIAESDTKFSKERIDKLLGGLAANSKEVREITKKYLEENITNMKNVVEELKMYLEKLSPGTENYTATYLKILELTTKQKEYELQKFETNFSEFDEIMEKYSRSDAFTQAEYDIKKYDAMLKGAKQDSSVVKSIERMMARQQVKLIGTAKSNLQQLLGKFRNKPEQTDKILLQIRQLQAEQKKLLVDIKDKLSENISTFNLPSDIKPITYYEAVTSDNTHRNVSVVAGDTIVNITVDNMSGDENDLNRMGEAVQKAVRETQKGFVRQFANDVKAGMGSRYYSFNNYKGRW